MLLLNLPAELLLCILQDIPSVGDKCQLLQTCTYLNTLLSTHVGCWSNLDLSPYTTITNSSLLTWLKYCNISLYTITGNYNATLNSITRLDVSGCWCLSQDMVVALSKSFNNLQELCLNGYRLGQRDHLYQVRPFHDLSSMIMDLSKRNTNRLVIPHVLLANIVTQIPSISSLAIQYQDLTPLSLRQDYFVEFFHIKHLDISSCIINQPALQAMLRTIGARLLSLKMLNIDLNHMSWLCVGQYGKNLECLHVSCNEPLYLPCIRQTVSNLKFLSDFRLTRLRTGTIDPIIEKLNPVILKRLDISPKMNIYPSSSSSISVAVAAAKAGTPRIKRHVKITSSSTPSSLLAQGQISSQQQTRKRPAQVQEQQQHYATTVHDLLISDISFHHLSLCHQLTELRLCFPTITSGSQLESLFQAIPQLETFELRQQQPQRQQKQDYLKGLKLLKHLRQAYFYGVYISQDCINTFTELLFIGQITIHQGGNEIESKENQALLLDQGHILNTLELGQLTRAVTSKDIWPNNHIVNCLSVCSNNITFVKKSNNKFLSWWCVQ
jgi:hypothetical protein